MGQLHFWLQGMVWWQGSVGIRSRSRRRFGTGDAPGSGPGLHRGWRYGLGAWMGSAAGPGRSGCGSEAGPAEPSEPEAGAHAGAEGSARPLRSPWPAHRPGLALGFGVPPWPGLARSRGVKLSPGGAPWPGAVPWTGGARWGGLALALVLGLGPASALAQADAPVASDKRCWHGSQSYSPGSQVRIGGRIHDCGPDQSWRAADGGGANCLHADRSYTSGALVSVGPVLLACEPSGAWRVTTVE